MRALFSIFCVLSLVQVASADEDKGKDEKVESESPPAAENAETEGAVEGAAEEADAKTPEGADEETVEAVTDEGETAPDVVTTEPVNPICGNVKCANHGVCVVQNGNPTCACDEGYLPDEINGLSCLPIAGSSPAGGRRDMAEGGAFNSLDPKEKVMIAELYQVFPGYSLDGLVNRYAALKKSARYGGDFVDFLNDDLVKKRRTGIVLVGVGGVLAAVSAALIGIAAASPAWGCENPVSPPADPTSSSEEREIFEYEYEQMKYDACAQERNWIFAGFGIGTLTTSAVLLTTGSIYLGKGAKNLRRMNSWKTKEANRKTTQLKLSPTLNHKTGQYGLAATITF